MGTRSGELTFETFANNGDTLLHCWTIDSLKNSLQLKHRETVFVDVYSEPSSGSERFLLTSLTYRSGPIIANLPIALSNGDVNVDYTLKVLPTGGIDNHGYLFRMSHKKLDILFAKSQQFPLLDTQDYLNY
jgi:hypothetical protein